MKVLCSCLCLRTKFTGCLFMNLFVCTLCVGLLQRRHKNLQRACWSPPQDLSQGPGYPVSQGLHVRPERRCYTFVDRTIQRRYFGRGGIQQWILRGTFDLQLWIVFCVYVDHICSIFGTLNVIYIIMKVGEIPSANPPKGGVADLCWVQETQLLVVRFTFGVHAE